MAEYIGKKMSDHEARGVFADGFVIVRFEDDSIEERQGEIVWYGKDEKEAYKQFGSIEEPGCFGVIPGSDYYKNSLGSIF